MIFLSVLEIFSRVYISQNQDCLSFLPESNIYPGQSSDFYKKLCNSYSSVLMYNVQKGLEFPITYFEPNQHYDHVNINSVGLRGNDFIVPKPDNTFRIFVTGGSTTFGSWATSDDSTIPGNLQQSLNDIDSDINFEVYNLGVFTRTSFEEVYALNNQFLDYEPDLIIVYDGWNDLYENFNKIEENKNASTLPLSKYYHIMLQYYKTLSVVNMFFETIQPIRADTIPDAENMSLKANFWVNNWSGICNTGKDQGFDVIIFLQPILGTGEKNFSEWEKKVLDRLGHTSVAEYYPHFQEKIDELDHLCYNAFDISNIFDDYDETIYYDMGHTADKGKKIVSDKMLELISPYLERKIQNISIEN